MKILFWTLYGQNKCIMSKIPLKYFVKCNLEYILSSVLDIGIYKKKTDVQTNEEFGYLLRFQ